MKRISTRTRKLQRKQVSENLKRAKRELELKKVKAYVEGKNPRDDFPMRREQEDRLRGAVGRALKNLGHKKRDFSPKALALLQSLARSVYRDEIRQYHDPSIKVPHYLSPGERPWHKNFSPQQYAMRFIEEAAGSGYRWIDRALGDQLLLICSAVDLEARKLIKSKELRWNNWGSIAEEAYAKRKGKSGKNKK